MADVDVGVLLPGDLKNLNKGKKRKLRPHEWKDAVRKKCRNSGKAYKTRKDVEKPPKKLPEQNRICELKVCSNEGCAKLNYEEKLKLFREFYAMTYNDQSRYLAKCISARRPKRSILPPGTSKKQTTFDYTIVKHKLKVCKKTFSDIFALSHKRVQVLQTKLKQGDFLPTDGRGKHNNRPAVITEDIKERIRDHIRSFPSQESHYSRSSNKKMCLSPDLTLARMFRMFKRENPEVAVKKYLYRLIFREFNLRFGFPRSDTCKECDKNYNKLIAADSEEEKKKIMIESEIHHRRAEGAYASLKTDTDKAKVDKNIIVLTVDLQQVLFCPTLHHSNIFYQRQLSNYNFAIHDMGKADVSMYLWNETIAKRGSAEIASCILKHILDNFEKLQDNEERKLIVWSDRCVGQNNNWRMLSVMNYVMRLKYFTSVEQKFLCSGHSFLPCDRDFALVEKRKKVCKVYVPTEWKFVIAEARLEKPFVVVEMQQEDFKDLSVLDKDIKRDMKLKITEVKWLKFSSEELNCVKVRKSHNLMQPWSTYNFLKPSVRNPYLCHRPENLRPLYGSPIAITKEKFKDLQDMVPYLKPEYQEYYKTLVHTT